MAKYRKYPVRHHLNNQGAPVWGMCDQSGEMHPRETLVRQMVQAGDDVTWSGFWVYEPYLDPLDDQKRPPPVKGDPFPVLYARPGPIVTDQLYRMNFGGEPIASQGDAAPCFEDNGVGLAQSQSDGWIGYSYTDPEVGPLQIDNIGVESIFSDEFALVLEYSIDGVTWVELQTTESLVYAPTLIKWFPIFPPIALAYRIRGINNIKLSIRQLYFTLNSAPLI